MTLQAVVMTGCPRCGTGAQPGATFCSHCALNLLAPETPQLPYIAHTPPHGQAIQHPGFYGQPQPYYFPPPPPQPSNGLGVAGFVTGLLGLVLFWIPGLGILLGLLGAILGGAGIGVGRKRGAGIGLAVSGLILGIISLIPAILFMTMMAGLTAGATAVTRHHY